MTGGRARPAPTLAKHLWGPGGTPLRPALLTALETLAGARLAQEIARIRLLYEAAPLALVAEAAGGRASTGRARILEHVATHYDQRTPCYIGSAEEVAWARRIIAAFEQAQAAGQGVVVVDGRLIENLHVADARRLVGLAEAIAAAA